MTVVNSMRANGMSSAGEKARAFKSSRTAISMKGIGKKIKRTAGDDLSMTMVMWSM